MSQSAVKKASPALDLLQQLAREESVFVDVDLDTDGQEFLDSSCDSEEEQIETEKDSYGGQCSVSYVMR